MSSKWKEYGIPCPCGESSDAYAIDKDGKGFCFRGDCNKFFPVKEYKEDAIEQEEITGNVTYDYYPHRGISRSTMEFYNVQTMLIDGKPDSCGFVLPNKAVQIKKLDPLVTKNRYRVNGNWGEAGLFGRDKFDAGSKESVTIVEGFHDTLAAYEMLMGNSAVVSIKSSSTAKSDCIKDWEWINSFKRIVIAIEDDEPGVKASSDIAALFDFNKVYRIKLTAHKDANEYLLKGASGDFLRAWKNARRFAPDNIISSFTEIEKALDQDEESLIAQYPFKNLNSSLYGLHEGEVILVDAMDDSEGGTGKTEFLRSLEHFTLKTTNHPIGIIHLEEDNGTTVKAIAGYELGVPAVLPDCGLSKEDILAGYKRAVKDNEGRVHIYSSFDIEHEDTFLNNIRFLIAAAGCKIIFFDHISWLATGNDDETDERKKLDRISQKLKLLMKELRACLVMISHTTDDGKTRGSRYIGKVANTRISLKRDKTNHDSIVRNTVEFIIRKARLGGRTGPGGSGIFNQETGRLEDVGPIS
jgi:twinkle protein